MVGEPISALLAEMPRPLLGLFVFLYGAIIGSFLNVCIYRLPLGQSLWRPASRCRHCRTRIEPIDNLPIIGYFLRRGRCRHCGRPYSPRYACVEALSALLAVLVWLHWGLTAQALFIFLFIAAMLVVVFVDLDHRIIPDQISIGGMYVGLLAALLMPLFMPRWVVSPQSSLLGMVLGGGSLWAVSWIYRRVTGTDGIGFGDVKLLGMIGACFGWQAALATIVFSSLVGSFFGIAQMLLHGRSSKYPIPFGPFIAVAAILSIWYAPIVERLFKTLALS